MANVRINQFQNLPQGYFVITASYVNGRLCMQVANIAGSLSFNNLAMIMSASGTTAKTLSISFGLYSLNGSTLSLANSAFFSSNPAANALSWITLATSATQDITPGTWFFAYIQSTSGNNNMSLMGGGLRSANVGYGGPFFRGIYSAATGALPASIATSDMIAEGTTVQFNQPYVLISA